MQTKYKTGIIIFATLLIGILIGAISVPIIGQKMLDRRIERFRTPPGFAEHMIRILQPDEAQAEQIERILQSHGEKIQSINEEMRLKMMNQGDALLKDLEPVLNPDQLNKFELFMKRQEERHRNMQRGMKNGRQHPPGFGPEMRRPGMRKNFNTQRFFQHDENSDGKVSREEAGAMPTERFDELDINQDGFIDSTEVTKCVAEGRRILQS